MCSKNYGVQYDSWLYFFFLYWQVLKDLFVFWLVFKGQLGGLSYKDWLGLMFNCEDKFNKMQFVKVVCVVGQWNKMSLWCFVQDMDKVKVCCWYQY